MSAGADVLEAIEDPFDCIFRSSASVQDIHHPDTFSSPPRRRNYNQKRSQRRHRMRHKENMDVWAFFNWPSSPHKCPLHVPELMRKVELCGRLSMLLLSPWYTESCIIAEWVMHQISSWNWYYLQPACIYYGSICISVIQGWCTDFNIS